MTKIIAYLLTLLAVTVPVAGSAWADAYTYGQNRNLTAERHWSNDIDRGRHGFNDHDRDHGYNDRDWRGDGRHDAYRSGYEAGLRARNDSYIVHQGRPYDYSVYTGNGTVVHSTPYYYPYGFAQPRAGQSFYSYTYR